MEHAIEYGAPGGYHWPAFLVGFSFLRLPFDTDSGQPHEHRDPAILSSCPCFG